MTPFNRPNAIDVLHGSYLGSFLSYSAISVQNKNIILPPLSYLRRRQNFSTTNGTEKLE